MHLKVIIYYSRRVKKCWLVSFSFAEVCFHLHQSPTLLFLLFSIQRVSADFAAGSRKIAGSLDYGVTSPGLCGWRKDSVRSAIFPVLCMVRVVNFPRPSQDLQNSWIWATVKNSCLSPQIWLILSSNVTKTCNYCFIALLTKELRRHSILCWITSVPTPPGKSWFSFCKISRSWKKGLVLEILLKGPGCGRRTHWCRCTCQNLWRLAQILFVYTKKSLAAGAVPWTPCNCCLSIYLDTAGVRRSWKNASGVLESPGNFCNQESGNPE